MRKLDICIKKNETDTSDNIAKIDSSCMESVNVIKL